MRMMEICLCVSFISSCTLKTISHIATPISDFVDDASCGESSDTDVHDFPHGLIRVKPRDRVVISFKTP